MTGLFESTLLTALHQRVIVTDAVFAEVRLRISRPDTPGATYFDA